MILEQQNTLVLEKWLKDKLNLTQYQKEILHEELLYNSPFKFYKEYPKSKSNIWWRLSMLPFGIICSFLFVCLPIQFIFTGKFSYNYKWLIKWRDKF